MLFVTRNNCIIRRKNVVQHVRCLKSVIRTVKNVDGHSYVFFSCRVQAGIWQQGKLKRDTGQGKIELYRESKN